VALVRRAALPPLPDALKTLDGSLGLRQDAFVRNDRKSPNLVSTEYYERICLTFALLVLI